MTLNKWEYLTLVIRFVPIGTHVVDTWVATSTEGVSDPDAPPHNSETPLTERLALLGEAGWEVVTNLTMSGTTSGLILKRMRTS
jgi:hypothetical protein